MIPDDLKLNLLDLNENCFQLKSNLLILENFFFKLIEEKDENLKELERNIISNQISILNEDLADLSLAINQANKQAKNRV